jgi:RNA polymerase sigma factor (sigma-70 family)
LEQPRIAIEVALDDQSRHQWVATHILPHEGEARGWLCRHIHRLTPSDLDDLIQEAYARLWGVELRGIANGRSYLFTVIRNLLTEQARRARIVPMERMNEIEVLRIPSEEPGPDRRVSALQELELLERVVEGLPKQCRYAFRLQKFHGLSQQEIARKMNITEKTVEKHLATALFRVTEALKEEMGGAPEFRPGIRKHDSARKKD